MLGKVEGDVQSMGEAIWKCNSAPDIRGVLKKVSMLNAQLVAQNSFQANLNLLRQTAYNSPLSGLQASRVKHVIRFTFGKIDYSIPGAYQLGKNVKTVKETRSQRLREFDCDVLIFCGLCFTTRTIGTMGRIEFDARNKGRRFHERAQSC